MACCSFLLFFFNAPSPSALYPLSLHDALPISARASALRVASIGPVSISTGSEPTTASACTRADRRSEEHTSELQSRFDLVCRLLLEKKKKKNNHNYDKKKTTGTLYCGYSL